MTAPIYIDFSELESIALRLGVSNKHVNAALKSTIRKSASRLRTMAARGLSRELNIQQKVLRGRLHTFHSLSANGHKSSLWIGLNPISFHQLKPKQNKKGVKASGGRFAKSAFIVTGSSRLKGRVFRRQGIGRLPIKRELVDIKNDASAFVRSNLLRGREFNKYLKKTLEHELIWRLRKL